MAISIDNLWLQMNYVCVCQCNYTLIGLLLICHLDREYMYANHIFFLFFFLFFSKVIICASVTVIVHRLLFGNDCCCSWENLHISLNIRFCCCTKLTWIECEFCFLFGPTDFVKFPLSLHLFTLRVHNSGSYRNNNETNTTCNFSNWFWRSIEYLSI